MSTRNKDKQGNRVPYGARVRLWLTAAFVTVILAACGGGGGSGGGGGQGGGGFTPDARATVVIESATDNTLVLAGLGGQAVPRSDFTQVNVRVSLSDGSPVADGTTVNFRTSNVEIASVSTLDDVDTDDINEFETDFGIINQITTGGIATFFVRGIGLGTVTVTASVNVPATGTNSNIGISGTGSAQFVVQLGSDLPPPPAVRLVVTSISDTVLPINTVGGPPLIGSSFVSEVNVVLLSADGFAMQPLEDQFTVTSAPTDVALLSTLDDPSTSDLNEFESLFGNGNVPANSGQATFFVHSRAVPGSAVISVSASFEETPGDETSVVTLTAQFAVEVVSSAANGLPSTLSLISPPDQLFVQGSGGQTSATLNLNVLDAAGAPVANPGSGPVRFNNVNLRVEAPNQNGSVLSAVNANGQSVVGSEVVLATTNGNAQFGFNTGNSIGVHRIVATADRADNNVDNGIQDPVFTELALDIGDGRLAGLVLDSPTLNAIRVNTVSDDVMSMGGTDPDDPDATYSLVFSVTASDSIGNPVLPNTIVNLGKVDAPLNPLDNSQFNFSGLDGNPQEGGTLFTVTTVGDGFLDDPTVVDEAVGVGDVLLTISDQIPGNAELEGMRIVGSVSTDTLLNVDRPFNNNDSSGSIVDDGAIIPYVIGRSVTGTVPPAVTIEQDGVGEFMLTYPTRAVGLPVAIFAQGLRVDNGEEETVADVVLLRFPGIAPATLSLSPNTIAGNTSVPITLCSADARGVPLRGIDISFNLIAGVGDFMVSDNPLVTGPDGCVTTVATSENVNFGDDELVVQFSGAGATADLTIVPPNTAFISAEPSIITLTTVSARRVIATVVNEANEPVSGLDVSATCDSPASISPTSVSTDIDGEAEFVVSTTGGTPTALTTGTCVFSVDLSGTQLSTSIIFSIPPVQPSPGP
jgi:hypothetical protein